MCEFTLHNNEECETILNEGWCVSFTPHNNEKCETILNEGWCVSWVSHNNEKCEKILNEGWCVSLHRITMTQCRVVCELSITQQWEVWDYTQCRVTGGVWVEHHIPMRSVRLHSQLRMLRVEVMEVDWDLCWKPEHETLCFFPCKVAAAGDERYLVCVRRVQRVQLRSFQGRIGSSSVFCNEWLFMCAWFFSFHDSLVADRSVMAASRLLGATAACGILLSFAPWHRKL